MLVNKVNYYSLYERSPLNHFFEHFSNQSHIDTYELLLSQLIVKSPYFHFELAHFKHSKEISIGSQVLNGY